MPLKKGKGKKVFSRNVSEMMHAGHPQDQALAASYRQQRKSGSGKHFQASKKASAKGYKTKHKGY